MSDSGAFLLPPDVRALIDADRAAAEPPAVIKNGVARRLEKALGLGVLALGASVAVSPSVAAAVAASAATSTAQSTIAPPSVHLVSAVLKKWVAGASISLAVGGGAVTLAHYRSADDAVVQRTQSSASAAAVALQRQPVQPNPADVGVTPPANMPSHAPEPMRSDVVPSGVTMPATEPPKMAAPRPAANSPADRLAEERALLDGARRALVHRDAAGALQTIRLHERLFQPGQLVQERESMRVQALVLSRDFGGARSAGDRFRRRFPHSVLLAVVDKSLEGVP